MTLIETGYVSDPSKCFGLDGCVWYDISVIPATCDDPDYKRDKCQGRLASYNLPVSLGCGG